MPLGLALRDTPRYDTMVGMGGDEIKGCLIMLGILIVAWTPIVLIVWVLSWLS